MKRYTFVLVFVFIFIFSWENSHAGEILRLVPAEHSNIVGIVVRDAPSVFGERIGKVYTTSSGVSAQLNGRD